MAEQIYALQNLYAASGEAMIAEARRARALMPEATMFTPCFAMVCVIAAIDGRPRTLDHRPR